MGQHCYEVEVSIVVSEKRWTWQRVHLFLLRDGTVTVSIYSSKVPDSKDKGWAAEMADVRRKKVFRKSRMIYAGILVLVVLLNAAAWNSTAFSDWYIAHVFPVWVNLYGRATGLFPFSVGEWMLAAGVVLVVLALALGVVWAGIGVWAGLRKICRRAGRRPVYRDRTLSDRKTQYTDRKTQYTDRKTQYTGRETQYTSRETQHMAREAEHAEGDAWTDAAMHDGIVHMQMKEGFPGRNGALGRFRRFSRGFGYFFVWTVLIVCLVMTLNCFILYHASTFSEHYFGEDTGEYTLVELIEVYNMVAEQCNHLAGEIERDERGNAVYGGGTGQDGSLLDMEDMAREMMRRLGETYPQLDGYYPRPKALLSSDFMCQQHMQGYYFPFSMEANYNDVMHILNFPSTMCHELAHLRGYIYEDEANFIGYLACVGSEDVFFQYAGYLSVLVYLNNDLYKAWKEERAAYEEAMAVAAPVAVDAQVWEDNIFVTEEEWERINGKALIDTEIVDKAADVFIDTNLKVNGIADGKISYSRVVRLLLQYYRQQL